MNWKRIFRSFFGRKKENDPSVVGQKGVVDQVHDQEKNQDKPGRREEWVEFPFRPDPTSPARVYVESKAKLTRQKQASIAERPGSKIKDRGMGRDNIGQTVQTPEDGAKTQFEGTTGESRKQLVVGLDFGTAFTKVVLGDGDDKFAVPLSGDGVSIADYVLASTFWTGHDDVTSISRRVGVQASDLKLGLITGQVSDEQLVNVAVFLAHVLRRIRAFVFNRKSDRYGRYYIDWVVNVGLPTDTCFNEELSTTYRKIVKVAWFISATEGRIKKRDVEIFMRGDVDKGTGGHRVLADNAISVFPEFVAQVVGYVRSPLRRPDLHLLVDVGAGTLDVTVFNVHQNEEGDVFPIFAKAVKPLGSRFLVKHRISGTPLQEKDELGPYHAIPNRERFAQLLGIGEDDLIKRDQPFFGEVQSVVCRKLRFTRAHKYPLSRRWEDGLPLFLCGGGAQCDFYMDVFGQRAIREFPIAMRQLPRPKSLDAPGAQDSDYHRLSVAYGLAFEPLDIVETVAVDDDLGQNNDGLVGGFRTCRRCNGGGGGYGTCPICGGLGFV